MKKKILLGMLMIAILTCLFAISVSAATEIDGIYYDLTVTDETTGTAAVTDANVNCELENVVIPETVTYNNVTYKVTTINANAFSGSNPKWAGNTHIKTVVIPASVNAIGNHTFRNCKTLESVTIKAKNANGISLSDANFYECSALTSVDMSQSDVTVLGQYSFYNCSELVEIKYSPRLTTIGGQALRLCKKLTSGDFSGTKLETIGSWGMGDCISITSLKLPTTFTGITGGNALQNMPITELVFPHSLTTLARHALPVMGQLYMIVMPEIAEDNTNINGSALVSTNPKVIIYSGDTYAHLIADGAIFAGYTAEPFENYDPNTTYTTKTLFYGATTCSSCNGLLEEGESFKFTDYVSQMGMGQGCTNCDNVTMTTTYDAMFTCLGYTVPEDGNGNIAVGYTVNRKSVGIYEEKTSNKIGYGLYIVLYDVLGENDILNDDETPTNGVLKINMEGTDYDKFSIKITGIADAQKETKFMVGAYVIDRGTEKTEISYINQGIKDEGDKYCYITYNGLVG